MEIGASGRSVGFIGLGGMGGAMAGNLLDAGWTVHGWNRTASRCDPFAERGMVVASTPREAAAAAETVMVSLYDDQALLDTVEGDDGIAAGCGPKTVVVEASTVAARTSSRAASAVEKRGATFLRAPVSGNTVVAAAGNLAFLCSGDRAAFERCSDLFDVLGKSTRWLGEGEEARYAKLALNLVIGGTTQLLAEALGLAEAAGIERRSMLELMQESAVGSPFVAYKTEPLVADDYSPTFTVDGMRKDLRLLFEAADEAGGVPLPAAALTDQLLAACQGLGWGAEDFAVLVRLVQQLRDGQSTETR
jgi:3-hydroxyisobutyrate dehydrogenase-like beta-hydroxyacid dehydrogenase